LTPSYDFHVFINRREGYRYMGDAHTAGVETRKRRNPRRASNHRDISWTKKM